MRRGGKRFLAHERLLTDKGYTRLDRCTSFSDSIQNRRSNTATQSQSQNLLEKRLFQYTRRSLRTIQVVREEAARAPVSPYARVHSNFGNRAVFLAIHLLQHLPEWARCLILPLPPPCPPLVRGLHSKMRWLAQFLPSRWMAIQLCHLVDIHYLPYKV